MTSITSACRPCRWGRERYPPMRHCFLVRNFELDRIPSLALFVQLKQERAVWRSPDIQGDYPRACGLLYSVVHKRMWCPCRLFPSLSFVDVFRWFVCLMKGYKEKPEREISHSVENMTRRPRLVSERWKGVEKFLSFFLSHISHKWRLCRVWAERSMCAGIYTCAVEMLTRFLGR